jgi:putative lipase involved disintegration of autophagic bodies
MIEEKKCVRCREVINPLRLKALPTAKTCVECSTTGAKRGVPMMYGEKDHTWTDMVIMDPEEFDRFEKLSKQKSSFDTLDKTELNSDGDDDGSDWNNTLLDGLE